MDRRQFIVRVGGGLAATSMVWLFTSCDDEQSLTGSSGEDEGFQVVSAEVSEHTHRITVLFADLENPPLGGVTYTSTPSGHIHDVSLTQTQLVALEGGAAVTVTSTKSAGHTHDWTVQRP